ncbi:MAG: DNA polymerase III subunit gamma/tau [Oscillospiraceae bacterium]|nr:DNA polymerase III subunit gamma/tau [Oscillospiraceae bacterium]
MYQALYRKWRPRTFDEVVGQAHITDTLRRQVATGHTSHAYLFTGTRGTGKTTCARILAKAVNCESPIDGAPCCSCEACRAIDSATALDVTELDAASNSGVDYVRALREEAIYTPAVLRKRVYIIDEVHMLTREAFNALLKILEEPPEHLLFILATTELHKVPATILSRCQRFAFKRILPRDMEQQLLHVAESEGIRLTGDGAELLARMANGALRDALSLLDQCRAAGEMVDSRAVLQVLGLAGSVQTVQLMRCALERRAADALALFDKLYRDGKDVAALLGELSDLGRELTMIKAAPDGARALLTGLYDTKTLLELTADTPLERFLFITETLQRCCAALGDSTRPRTDAELCLLRLCNESLCGDLNALNARVAALEEGGITVNAAGTVPAEQPKAAAPKPAPARQVLPIETRYDEPPMPEEYGERVFDIPDAPAPVVKSSPVPQPKTAPASPAGDNGVWNRLIDQYKGRLSVSLRVFLNMAGGILEDDHLKVLCQNDFVKTSLDKPEVISVLQEVTAREVGHEIRVSFSVGDVPKTEKKVNRPTPTPTPPPKAEPVTVAPVETPPWEEPVAPPADALEELMAKGKTLESFKIK